MQTIGRYIIQSCNPVKSIKETISQTSYFQIKHIILSYGEHSQARHFFKSKSLRSQKRTNTLVAPKIFHILPTRMQDTRRVARISPVNPIFAYPTFLTTPRRKHLRKRRLPSGPGEDGDFFRTRIRARGRCERWCDG